MKILYITTEVEDYLSDGILYGLRKKFGPDVVDYPQKESMYIGGKDLVDYGGGFTLWGLLPDIPINREHVKEQVENGYFDVIFFSDIYRQTEPYSHWNVYGHLERTKKFGKKLVFLDGTDDGKPAITEAFNWGTYFKRENPYNYPEVKIIGLSIPECKILIEKPKKTKPFVRYVQVPEAYKIHEIAQLCTTERFTQEKDYYHDLADSKYGFAMKKSGWDTPRLMEQSANWAVNCLYTKGWDWDGKDWDQKPEYTHPLGLVDMQNCVLWDSGEQLVKKLKSIDDAKYEQLSQASHDWVLNKTCEKMTDYVLANI